MFVAFFINQNLLKTRDEAKFNGEPPWVEKNSKSNTYGLFEPNGEIINKRSILDRPKNGELYKVLSFGHFFEKKGDYGLMILTDSKQTAFKVNGKTYTLYPFEMNPNSTINIHTKVPIEKDAQEIIYIIIKKPNFHIEEGNLDAAVFLNEMNSLRFQIGEKKDVVKKRFVYEKPIKKYNKTVGTGVFASELIDHSRFIFHAKSNEKFYLRVDNENQTDIDFAIIAFKDWKQVPLSNKKLINYAKAIKGETQVYQLNFPETDKLTNYQIIGIPNLNDYGIQPIYTSPRTVVHPNK